METPAERERRLQELRELETAKRVHRLERRDLRREATVDELNTRAKWAVRGVWIAAGMVALRLVQEGGLEMIPAVLSWVGG